MAKKSWIARNEKRKKTVEKYAEKRAALKEAGDYEALQKLLEMPALHGCVTDVALPAEAVVTLVNMAFLVSNFVN